MALTSSGRPTFVTWAAVLIVINAVGGLLFTALWPDLSDRGTVFTVSCVFAALFLLSAWFLWKGSRWGAIGTIVINVLNILLGIPGFFDPDPKSLLVGLIISIVLSLATIGLVLMPESRTYWNGPNGSAAT